MSACPTRQPDFLKTEDHVPWSWGIGNQVWAMFAAAMSGDVEQLRQLLEIAPSLIRCETDYRTPLHFAIRENQNEATKCLLECGAEVPYATGQGITERAAQMALDRDNRQMFNLLNEHQYERFGICETGERIANAIRLEPSSVSEALVRRHGTRVAGQRGNQPLHWAVMTRQRHLIKVCLEQGADINAVRPDGARPLDLTNGDYYYRGWRDQHPEGEPDHWKVMDDLLAHGAEYDLTTACRRGDRSRVEQILADDPQAANRDARYSTWYSGFSLRSAAKAGHLELVRILLEHGANPNRPEHGLAPFGGSVYDAAQNGHYEIVKLLLENGANPNQEVESSGCPLSQADERTTKLLREHGAIFDVFGCCYYRHVDDLRVHFQRDPRKANNASLFAVAAEQDQEMAEIFLSYQPDLMERMPARLGRTAEQTEWLVQRGMHVNQTDWLGVHALHHGCSGDALQQWIGLESTSISLIASNNRRRWDTRLDEGMFSSLSNCCKPEPTRKSEGNHGLLRLSGLNVAGIA